MPTSPHDATDSRTAQGHMKLWRPRADIVCCTVVGQLDAKHWPSIIKLNQEVVDGGYKLLSFYDWHEMTGYVSEARTELTIWCLANKNSLSMGHILVKHKLVAAGVSIAGALVRTLKAYTDRGEFETVYAETTRGMR